MMNRALPATRSIKQEDSGRHNEEPTAQSAEETQDEESNAATIDVKGDQRHPRTRAKQGDAGRHEGPGPPQAKLGQTKGARRPGDGESATPRRVSATSKETPRRIMEQGTAAALTKMKEEEMRVVRKGLGPPQKGNRERVNEAKERAARTGESATQGA
jgi:hypothetical protein